MLSHKSDENINNALKELIIYREDVQRSMYTI